MSRTSNIISGLSLALALSFAAAPLALAQEINGSYWENGGVSMTSNAVRMPSGYHPGEANGTTYMNGTVELPQGAKGAIELPAQNFAAPSAEINGPLNGTFYENQR